MKTLRLLLCLTLFVYGCGSDDNIQLNPNQNPIPTVLAINPVNATISPGTNLQYTANSQSGDVTQTAAWTSSDSRIATITQTGIVTALNPGVVTISASQGGLIGSTQLTVGQANAVSLAINPNSFQLALNTRRQLQATSTLANGQVQDVTNSVTWSSSNSAVATVSATGEVVAVAPGQVSITAGQGTTTATANVQIANVGLTSVSFTPALNSLRIGQQQRVIATGIFSDGTSQDITNSASWTSSNPNVATVTNQPDKGVITGVQTGTTTIQASLGEVGASFVLTVNP